MHHHRLGGLPITEFKINCEVAAWCRNNLSETVIFYHIPNGANNPIRGAKEKAMGVLRGTPDLFFFWNGQSAWIELKTGKGRLSTYQHEFFSKVENNGGRIALCRSLDEVKNVLKEWQVPLAKKEKPRFDF